MKKYLKIFGVIGLGLLTFSLVMSLFNGNTDKDDKKPTKETENEVYLVGDFNNWNYKDKTYSLLLDETNEDIFNKQFYFDKGVKFELISNNEKVTKIKLEINGPSYISFNDGVFEILNDYGVDFTYNDYHKTLKCVQFTAHKINDVIYRQSYDYSSDGIYLFSKPSSNGGMLDKTINVSGVDSLGNEFTSMTFTSYTVSIDDKYINTNSDTPGLAQDDNLQIVDNYYLILDDFSQFESDSSLKEAFTYRFIFLVPLYN